MGTRRHRARANRESPRPPANRAGGNPFAALGLPARADLTDDDVRAAWRRIAAATHPDRDDGGSPQRFALAAAAYATLRSSFGRGEALADMAEAAGSPGFLEKLRLSRLRRALAAPGRHFRDGWLPGRAWARLGVRMLVAAAIAGGAFAAAGWSPGALAVLIGALTWLAAAFRRGFKERSDG